MSVTLSTARTQAHTQRVVFLSFTERGFYREHESQWGKTGLNSGSAITWISRKLLPFLWSCGARKLHGHLSFILSRKLVRHSCIKCHSRSSCKEHCIYPMSVSQESGQQSLLLAFSDCRPHMALLPLIWGSERRLCLQAHLLVDSTHLLDLWAFQAVHEPPQKQQRRKTPKHAIIVLWNGITHIWLYTSNPVHVIRHEATCL